MDYYTSIIFLSLVALAAMCIIISESDSLKKAEKKVFYLTYLLIALSALAEWTGLKLDGLESLPKWPLMIAKCADYILTPMAGGAMIAQMNLRNRWGKALTIILSANAVFQIVSCFGGWVARIDDHNRYSHGPLYWVYAAIYLVVIAIVIVEFAIYGKAFHNHNRVSLYAIMGVVIVGIAVQELLGSEYRTSYIALTIAAILLYIHYSEFSQMASADTIQKQETLIITDTLTGLMNRYSYGKALEKFDKDGHLPENLCAFSIDINGLKTANDTHGHFMGDELICGAAECIRRVFEKTGKCFRTGGDEFIVFAELDKEQAEEALKCLTAEAKNWSAANSKDLQLAAGYAMAKDYPDVSAEKLVIEADHAMYSEKNNYYSSHKAERRTY